MAAKRLRQRASKLRAEGEAIKHSGWHRWKAPLAPRADGTRKVAYQSKARSTFFEIIGLIYWGLQARMQQSLETARLPVERQGKQVTNALSLRTKDMRAWRSLGRAVTDVKILVFNLGRLDFRQKHLVAYSMDVQLSTQVSSLEKAVSCAESMLIGLGALVEMRYHFDDQALELWNGASPTDRVNSMGAYKCWTAGGPMGTHAKDDGIVDDLQDVAHTQDLATVSESSPQVDRNFAWWQFSRGAFAGHSLHGTRGV